MKSLSQRLLIMATAALSLTVLALLFGLASPAAIQAESTLPPRGPAVTATPTPLEKQKADKNRRPIGAYIELQAQGAPTGAWGIVQWQDRAGSWHDVAGWQGTLSSQTRWWVSAQDFGAGPFQWVVRQGADGAVIGTSAPFKLPTEANETVQVMID